MLTASFTIVRKRASLRMTVISFTKIVQYQGWYFIVVDYWPDPGLPSIDDSEAIMIIGFINTIKIGKRFVGIWPIT